MIRWKRTCQHQGDLTASGVTKLTKIDISFEPSDGEAKTIVINTMLRLAKEKGVTIIRCHKKGTKILEVAATLNTTQSDEPFSNFIRVSAPSAEAADCFQLRNHEVDDSRNIYLEKNC